MPSLLWCSHASTITLSCSHDHVLTFSCHCSHWLRLWHDEMTANHNKPHTIPAQCPNKEVIESCDLYSLNTHAGVGALFNTSWTRGRQGGREGGISPCFFLHLNGAVLVLQGARARRWGKGRQTPYIGPGLLVWILLQSRILSFPTSASSFIHDVARVPEVCSTCIHSWLHQRASKDPFSFVSELFAFISLTITILQPLPSPPPPLSVGVCAYI